MAGECPPDILGSVIGWLGDFFRFWWSLLYWNTRKSLFRRKRDRAPCPCQNPSDSGRARETGCEAAQFWHQPRRFRRVCPLLVDTPDGLRCSVAARDVRPFWRRAVTYYVSAGAGLYLGVALLAFITLRLIGYPLSPATLLWPPRWTALRVARSDYFVAKAQRALNAHQVNEAILSLDVAFNANPRNYDAGMELAQLVSLGQPDVAERIFSVLMRDHPAQRSTTAEAWLRLLLATGRMDHAATLAATLFLETPAQRPAWLHALFFATRQTHDDQPLRELIAKHTGEIEPIYVALINSELLIRAGNGLRLLPGLTTELPPAAGTYGPYFQVSRLIALDRPADALTMLSRYESAGRMAPADIFLLRLDALAALGRQDLLVQRLEQQTVNAREVELICIHLVHHPNAAVLAALAHDIEVSHLPSDTSSFAAYSSYLVTCGAAQDWTKFNGAVALLKSLSGSRVVREETIEAFFRRQDDTTRLENILPLLPALPLNMIYALYDRFPEAAPAAVKLAPPQ